MSCRVKPQTDLFEACALLKVNRSETLDAHAEALVRCLGEAFGKPPRLYAPGISEFTFDEQWLRLEKSRARQSQVAREICFSVDHSKIRPQPSTVYTLTPDRWDIDQDIVHDRYGMDIGSTDLIYKSGFRIHLRTV